MTNTTSQRRRVLWFTALTIVVEFLWVRGWTWGEERGFHPPLVVMIIGMMWVPGVVSVLCRIVFKEGFSDVGWRAGPARYWAWAYLLPLGMAVLAYGVALILGKVAPASPDVLRLPVFAVLFNIPLPVQDAGLAAMVFQRFVLVALVGILPNFFLAFGEELGWRGYLLTRILRTGWPFPLLLGGLIWGLWHFPALFLLTRDHGPYSLAGYTTMTVLFGVFVSWLRLKSGSVWVAAMAHASYNAFVQAVGMRCFPGEDELIWVGEYGILIMLPYAALVAWLYGSGRVREAVRPVVEAGGRESAAAL